MLDHLNNSLIELNNNTGDAGSLKQQVDWTEQ